MVDKASLVCFRTPHMFSYEKPRKNACQFNGFQLMLYNYCNNYFVQGFEIAQSVARLVCVFLCNKCRSIWVRASKSSLITFLRFVFSGYCIYVFYFSFEIFISFRIFFTRSMIIITGRRHWVLTKESPRLTTMDGNNILVKI